MDDGMEEFGPALKAIGALRRAAWKGDIRGVKRAMEALDGPMQEFCEAWSKLQDANLAWQQFQEGEVQGERDEFREELDGSLSFFDEVLKVLLGPSEFELKMLAEG